MFSGKRIYILGLSPCQYENPGLPNNGEDWLGGFISITIWRVRVFVYLSRYSALQNDLPKPMMRM